MKPTAVAIEKNAAPYSLREADNGFGSDLTAEFWGTEADISLPLCKPCRQQQGRGHAVKNADSQLTLCCSSSFQSDLYGSASVEAQYVVLKSAPIILQERLTSADFVEFIVWLKENPCVPLQMMKPPAVARIFASKACKTAIKFGDEVSHENICRLIQDLSKTNFPFQCAHGRPSLVPLGNIQSLVQLAQERAQTYRSLK